MNTRRKLAWKRMLSLVLALMLAIPAVQMSGNDRIQAEAAAVSLSIASQEIVKKTNGEGNIEDVVFGDQVFTIGKATENLILVIYYDYAFNQELLEEMKKNPEGHFTGRLAEINVSNMTSYTYPCIYAGDYTAMLYSKDDLTTPISSEVRWTVSTEISGYTAACLAREYMVRELQSFPAEIDMSSFDVPEKWVGVIGEAISSRGTTYMVPYYGLQYTWEDREVDVDENGNQLLDENGNPTTATARYLKSVIPTYWITQEQYQVMETYVDNVLELLIPEGATDEQKIAAIYFFETLISNSVYTDKVSDAVNPYSTLMEKGSVCDGYARTLELLCYKAGLNTVKGGSGSDNGGISHAWNTVYVEDAWYQFDSTWDNARDTVGNMFQTNEYYIQTHSTNGKVSWSQGGYLLPVCTSNKYADQATGAYHQSCILSTSRGVILPWSYNGIAGLVYSDGTDILFANNFLSSSGVKLQEGSSDVLAFYFNAAGKQPEVFAWSAIPSAVLPGDTLKIAGGAVGYMKDSSNPNEKTGEEGSFRVSVSKIEDNMANEVASYNVKALEILEFKAPEEAGQYAVSVECNSVFRSEEIRFNVVEQHETKTLTPAGECIEIGRDYYILNGTYNEFVGDYSIVNTSGSDLGEMDIVVKDGFSNKITLNGFTSSGVFDASAAGSMELVLKGDNSFASSQNGIAAMTVSEHGDFVISGDGNLSVTSGKTTDRPAICMSNDPNASLTIGGGIITAEGGAWCAAIGVPQSGYNNITGSKLIVAAGTIYATPGYGCKAALGGSLRSASSKIYVFGGNIITNGTYVDGTANLPLGKLQTAADVAYTDKRVKTKLFVVDGGAENANKWVQSVDFGEYLWNAYAMKADSTGKVYIYAPTTVKLENIKVTFGDTMCTDEPDLRVKRGDEAPIWLNGSQGRNKTTLYTDLVAGTYTNEKGKTAKGKIVWIATKNGEFDYDEVKHTVTTKSDTSVVSVSGSGAVTAKAEGTIYVLAIDTATFKTEKYEITVKAAPATVALYKEKEGNPAEGDVVYATSVVPYGGDVSFFVKGYIGKYSKTSNTVKLITDEKITYSVTVPAKYKDYISVTEGEGGKFTVTVADSEDLKTLSKGKPLAISLSVVCDQSGKKATFKLTVSNPIKTTVLSAQEGTKATVEEDTGILHVTLDSALSAAQTGFIKEVATPYDESKATTDKTKIISIMNAEAFEYNKNGDIVAVGKPTAAQKKIKLAVDKATGGYKITAAKGTPSGTTAYFIIFHNSYNGDFGVGYQLVKVTVGEANHYTDATLAPTVETLPEGMEWNGSHGSYLLTVPSALDGAQSLTVKITTTLADQEKDATDTITIYNMASTNKYEYVLVGETEADAILQSKGALSAGQKKVTMKPVKGTTDQFTITAAKKTPEGTIANFAVFCNGVCVNFVQVTVGKVNNTTVTDIVLAEEGNAEGVDKLVSIEAPNDSSEIANVYTISVPYNSKAATKVILTEKISLSDEKLAQTDVNLLYAIGKADGYEVEPNERLCTVTTKPTSAQKKITLKAVKNTRNYTLNVAKGAPVGTKSYFLIYHNVGGYAILKVVVTEAE